MRDFTTRSIILAHGTFYAFCTYQDSRVLMQLLQMHWTYTKITEHSIKWIIWAWVQVANTAWIISNTKCFDTVDWASNLKQIPFQYMYCPKATVVVKPAISTHMGQFQSWENNKEERGTGTSSFSPKDLIDNLTLLMLEDSNPIFSNKSQPKGWDLFEKK